MRENCYAGFRPRYAECVEDVEPPDLLLKVEQFIVLSHKPFEGLEIVLGHLSKRVHVDPAAIDGYFKAGSGSRGRSEARSGR